MTNKKHRLLLGAHMSVAGGLEKAIQNGELLNCSAIQIFTKSNRQWYAKPISKDEEILFQKTLKNSSIVSVIAHSSYLINIGSPLKLIEEKSYISLVQELQRCKQLGIKFLVIHPGAHLKDDINKCLTRITHNLDKALIEVPGNVSILLENTAGQGTNLGYSFEQLAIIREKAQNKKRIQFCFDTCHAFAAGYDLRSAQTYKAVWEKYDQIIGIEHLKAIHINDSQKSLSSRIDRHEHIGKGKLGLEFFDLLFNDPRFFDIPKILETPKKNDLKDDKVNLETLRNLLSDQTKKLLDFKEEQGNSSKKTS